MSENITLVSKEYAESVFTTGPVIKEITSSDGSVSVFVNGPKVDLKVKSGGGSDDNNLYAFRIYLKRSNSTEFNSAVEYLVNDIVRHLLNIGGSGNLFFTWANPKHQDFNDSEPFSFLNMDENCADIITVILSELYPLDKKEFVQMVKYQILNPYQDFIELLPRPVYSGY